MSGLVLHNCRIRTGDPGRPQAASVLIDAGQIVSLDSARPDHASAVDLGGRLVVPGFWDSHAHLMYTGMSMAQVQLKGALSIEEVQRRVAERAASAAPGEWIEGAGWDQNDWPEVRFPSTADLDFVAPDHPVMLVHTSGHCAWVNSAALRAAGIDASTTIPDGGSMPLDMGGRPAGMLFDNAMELVAGRVPSGGPESRVAAIQRAVVHAHSLGIVGVHAMDVGPGELAALQALQRDRQIRLRVHAFLSAKDESLWQGHRTGDGDEWLLIGGVKWFADGALGSLTAWMEGPYEGSNDCGFPLQPVEELEASVRRALQMGLAPAIHAIGDRANREVLELLERTASVHPELPRRIEHAQLLAPGLVERFRAGGITASMQPIHATQDMAKVDRYWGRRGRYAYTFRSLLNAGVNLAFGSDTPVETMDPLAGIQAAVARQRSDGTPSGGWYPEERITVEEALRACTTGPAFAVRADGLAGRVANGYAADCAVLSQDILSNPASIGDTAVDMTIVGGQVVYVREGSGLEQYAATAAGANT